MPRKRVVQTILKWKDTFKAYLSEFSRLHARILKEKSFIQSRFQELKPQILQKQREGCTFVPCGSCEAVAGLVSETHPWGATYSCMVCQNVSLATKPTTEKIACDKCGIDFEFFKPTVKACPHCAEPIDTDKLISLCKAKYQEGGDWWEDGAPCVAYCHECECPKASVFYIDGLWSCVSCFDRGWSAVACPHCDEFVTGDMEKVKYFACCKCEDERRREIIAETKREDFE